LRLELESKRESTGHMDDSRGLVAGPEPKAAQQLLAEWSPTELQKDERGGFDCYSLARRWCWALCATRRERPAKRLEPGDLPVPRNIPIEILAPLIQR
jgi:hypothetical protein